MSLHVKSADVPERKVVRTGVEGEGAMVVRRGYGNECSLMCRGADGLSRPFRINVFHTDTLN